VPDFIKIWFVHFVKEITTDFTNERTNKHSVVMTTDSCVLGGYSNEPIRTPRQRLSGFLVEMLMANKPSVGYVWRTQCTTTADSLTEMDMLVTLDKKLPCNEPWSVWISCLSDTRTLGLCVQSTNFVCDRDSTGLPSRWAARSCWPVRWSPLLETGSGWQRYSGLIKQDLPSLRVREGQHLNTPK